jgi:glutamate N-acetyltransferase/amino-acid N-acetyltransferase
MNVLDNGSVTSAKGYQAGGYAAGIKATEGAPDLAILISDIEATVAATFTTIALPSPAVTVNRERIGGARGRGVVVNSGNANAATGNPGKRDAAEMARLLAERLGVAEELAYVCSTGVIGVPLPMEKLRAGIPQVPLKADGGHDFARAIMTTDTVQKEIAVEVETDGRTITIGGCCKGAGMIHPNMATMLAFITTDAPVEADFLQSALRRAVADSFNMIDIDGDMSTNDTVLLFANGAAGGPAISGGAAAAAFEEGLAAVCKHLATSIVRDAEGGTKLIEVRVTGAKGEDDARAGARKVAQSLMVKTAIHGHDPNWGRIFAAVANVDIALDFEAMTIKIGDYLVFAGGAPQPYDHVAAVAYLKGEDVLITIDIGLGTATATAWGSNLSEEYVTLNSVYTT